jgi:hypothetical protein
MLYGQSDSTPLSRLFCPEIVRMCTLQAVMTASMGMCFIQKAQAAAPQEQQDQHAADEASKLAQPLSQRLRQHGGNAEEEPTAASGTEQQMVSPEQAAAGPGVNIDTSADVSATTMPRRV